MQFNKTTLVLFQAEGAENGEAAPADASAPSTSGAAADSPAPAANGEAATPGTEGTAKKVKKEKKVWTGSYSIGTCSPGWASLVLDGPIKSVNYMTMAMLHCCNCQLARGTL